MDSPSSALLIRVGISLPPVALSPLRTPITVGRDAGSAIVLDDHTASRDHAILDRPGGGWILTDVSLNGTRVTSSGEAPVTLRGNARKLRHEDLLLFGSTTFRFQQLGEDADDTPPLEPKVPVTPRQHDVLMALSEPLRSTPGAAPASNREIGAALFLTDDALRGHLSALYRAFEVPEGTQLQRRMWLASQWWRAEVRGQRG